MLIHKTFSEKVEVDLTSLKSDVGILNINNLQIVFI